MRRLRLGIGGSLYKKPGEQTYTVDLSKMRHKTRCVATERVASSQLRVLGPCRRVACPARRVSRASRSRFYGPQISTLPATIQPFVEEYEASLVFEFTGDNPYLFSMASSYQYGQSSSAWSQLVKVCTPHTLSLIHI